MNADRFTRLLRKTARQKTQLSRHMLMAALLCELLDEEAIVVGGTAEEYWTRDQYHPTDLDICVPMTRLAEGRLRSAGFVKHGRHWTHPDVPAVAIEFPDTQIDGDPTRAVRVPIGGAVAVVIGLDDLYMDRLRQVTANPSKGSREYTSAIAVMAAGYEDLDLPYLERRFRAIARREPRLAQEMRSLDRRIVRDVRGRLSTET